MERARNALLDVLAPDPTASDALFTLQAGVGLGACPLCLCDMSLDGAVTAVDALITLARATGLPTGPRICPIVTP
jgi:hypothetical protein